MLRRNFVQLGLSGIISISMPNFLRAKSLFKSNKDTSMILVWLGGGPSQLDTYDMKPNAPAEIRGFWNPISTCVPGMQICEHLPKQAKRANKFSLIRSINHSFTAHHAADHLVLTGHEGLGGSDNELKFPSMGSVITSLTGPRKAGMPPYVSVPTATSGGSSPGCFGGSFLGRQYDPLQTGGDPNSKEFKINMFDMPGGMVFREIENRQQLLKNLNKLRYTVETPEVYDTMDNFRQKAYDMVVGEKAKNAFQINEESSETRDKYGRNRWGQSVLLARRLVEAGSTLVTVGFGGWDHHNDLESDFLKFNFPRLDSAISALLDDLEDRNILEKVLVVVMGEFGRTPKLNNGLVGGQQGTPGRDHWPNAMSCLIAGGGVQGGRIIGETDQHAAYVTDRPVGVSDMHATIYHILGLDPHLRIHDRSGRPVFPVDHGSIIHELF